MYAPPGIQPPMPLVMSNNSPWSLLSTRIGLNLGVPSAQTNPTGGQAMYVPFIVTQTCTWTRGFWYNGSTTTGNACVAIYTPDATRQATTGAVAQSGTSVIQSAAFAASYVTTPGIYYMAISFSAATVAGCFGVSATALWKQGGPYTQATGVHPLPSSAIFGTWTSFVMPYFGITQTSFAI